MCEHLGGEDVAKVGGSVKRLNTIGGGNTSLKHERANDIVDRTNDVLGFTILRRGVWARHPKMKAAGEEESAGTRVVKLLPVVTLDDLDCHAKLCLYIGKEVSYSGKRIRLEAQRKRPQIMRAVVKKN